MLYDAYQAHSDVLAPVRLMAEAARGWLAHPWPVLGGHPMVRSLAAASELLSRAGMSRPPPAFGLRETRVGRHTVAIREEIAERHPFCTLLHFRKETAIEQPRVLLVAPLSGHFPTLLRGTVESLLPDHDVYIT